MREEVPGDAFFYSRVRALLMFGEGANMSSSESSASSALGVRVPGVPETGLRREVGVCVGLFPVCGSRRHSHKAVTGSLIEAAPDVGV